MKDKKKRNYYIGYFISFLTSLLFGLGTFYLNFYNLSDFDGLIFSLMNFSKGVSTSSFVKPILLVTFYTLIFILFLSIFYFDYGFRLNFGFNTKKRDKKVQIIPSTLASKNPIKFSLIIFLITSIYLFLRLDISTNIRRYMTKNRELYEKYYVKAEEKNIKFPNKKRNLVYIISESMEATLFSEKGGGQFKKSVIPELEKIAQDNVNFSYSSRGGGFKQITGCTMTIGGLVCQTSGTDLKMISIDNEKGFLKGVYTLTDALKKNGYNIEMIMGSDSHFHEKDVFFKEHGNTYLLDYYEALRRNLIPENYHEWWGYEDSKLFSIAKGEINNLAQKKEPFALLILTANTHFPDGYIEKNCDSNQFNKKFLNSYYCSSKQIGDFVSYLKDKPFYQDTTIVITGDHLSMQRDVFKEVDDNQRYVYNAFLNSSVMPKNEKRREFTTLDIYPTILGAMGAKIKGNQLGFGTNLFSGKETLVEKLGYDKFREEISKTSLYYDKYLVKKRK